jgi:hypothetical protein
MATSYVHPVARFPTSRVKIRPKLALAPAKAKGRPADEVTEDRTAGVGELTSDPTDEARLPSLALVREAVDTALDSIEILERQAKDVARRFRRQALADANVGLSYLVQSTQTLLRLADMTATAAGTTLEAVCESHHISAPADTNLAVSSLIREQLAEDWSALAAVLEQRYLSALAGWRSVFETLGGSAPNPYGTAA